MAPWTTRTRSSKCTGSGNSGAVMGSEIVRPTIQETDRALTAHRASLIKVGSRLGVWGFVVAASVPLLDALGVTLPWMARRVFISAAAVSVAGILTAAVSVSRSLRPGQKLLRAAALIAASFGMGVALILALAMWPRGIPSDVLLAIFSVTAVLGITLIFLLIVAFVAGVGADPVSLESQVQDRPRGVRHPGH